MKSLPAGQTPRTIACTDLPPELRMRENDATRGNRTFIDPPTHRTPRVSPNAFEAMQTIRSPLRHPHRHSRNHFLAGLVFTLIQGRQEKTRGQRRRELPLHLIKKEAE